MGSLPQIAPGTSRAFVEMVRLEPKANGPLNGLTFAVKDLIDIAGYRTSCGNPTWRDTHPPAAANAVCVDQLLYAGAEGVGKTVTDELAFGLDGENVFHGTPLNPRAPDRVPGGSSSGSASAVACGIVDFALGTDTGGSVRVPAANCGIAGFRPTHGRVSVAGVMPFAPGYDTVGVLARDADILARTSSVLLGCPMPDAVEVGTVHLLTEPFQSADPGVREALEPAVALLRRNCGDRVRETSLGALDGARAEPLLPRWNEVFRTVQWAEIWSCLGSWIEDTRPELGPRARINFELARSLDRGGLNAAVQERERLFRRLSGFLGPTDLLCLPTAPAPAPRKGTLEIDRRKGTYYLRTVSFVAIAGIGRLPQVSLPLGLANGVPVGLSLIGAYGADAFLLAVARDLEQLKRG